jgi:hypothetical protein
MFNDEIARLVIKAADDNGIEPAALLAIVEVETGGKTFEQDGRTPQFLYERHVAYREASKIGKALLSAFTRAGLAIPKWDRATQYKDQGSSAKRLQLIGRARAIDEEVANRSASWGLGQTMGNLAEPLGFASAVEMVEHMTGLVAGQIDCMVRELKRTNLVKSLNDHDWIRTARIYNGPGYAANAYDVKLGDAFKRWSRKLPALAKAAKPTPEQLLARDEIEEIQNKLRDLGYAEVGEPDGRWNTKTTGAWSAFQAHEGLTVNGHYDAPSKAAFDAAIPRPVTAEREMATIDDLRDKGSDTIKHADNVSLIGKAKLWFGATLFGGGTAEQVGLLDKASDASEKVDQAWGLFDHARELCRPLLENPGILIVGLAVIIAGWLLIRAAERIRQNRLRDHQTGEHAGPSRA